MVGIVSGSTLGLFNTSLFTLGARGNLGSAGMGAGSEAVRLNVATGNLVLQHGDDLLAAQGLDFRLLRTYNSQGQWDDDNGDNWRMGPARRVRDGGLAGRNQAGATAWRVAEDGSESAFTYDIAAGCYRSTDGDGAYDTLAWDANTGRWTFTDGDTRTTEVYAGDAEGGVLLSCTDSNGLATLYSYVAGRLAQVVDASGQTTSFVYAGTNLVEVRVARGDLSATPVSTVRYEYDAQNRLQRVVTDLTPADGSISDGNTYWVRYGYDGSSTRVNLVEQKDGSRLAIGYVQTGSGAQGWRVSSLTDALDRVTRFAYDTVARTATVTSPLGLQTVYSYDAQARLTGILEPAVGGSTALTTLAYDTEGNLLSVLDALGRRLTLAYDDQGRLVQQQDAAGNTLRRTYDAAGLLATETVFAQPDPDGAGAAAPATPLTRRYVYDAQRNLRFEISAEGRVTEHRYDAQGQRSASLQYTVATYPVAGLATEAAPTLAQLQTWAAQANPTQRQLTEYRYDARGLLQQMARYALLAADGSGVLDAQALVTTYVYDSYGQLRQTLTNGQQQTFTYDGLGRLLVSTDALGRQVSVSQYDDANHRSTTTLLGGLVRTSVFDAAGELITVTEGSAAAADLGTTRFFYDADGRLRMSLSPAGQASHLVYDERGRKVADIDADGYVTRYVFDDAGQLVQTVRHATPVSLARLVAANGEPLPLTLAGLDLANAPDDRYEWALYDTAGRLVRTVDAEGAITDYTYDGASRQVAVTRYAAPLTNLAALRSGGATLANTNPPSLNPAADRLTRSVYSRDGLLVAQVDAEGHLSENNYDAAGNLLRARRHARAPIFIDLQTGTVRPGRLDGSEITTLYLYDAAGRLVATRDAEGYFTAQVYDRSGNLAARTRYATPGSGFTPSPASAEDQTWTYHYNTLNQLESETDPDGTVTTHQYDDAGRLIASERGWQTTDVRRQRLRYDVQGRLAQELAPEHAALLSAASTPQEIDAVFAAYATTYTYDRDGHRIAVRNAKGQTSLLYYDAQGRLEYTVSAVGEVQRQRYNAFDQLESSTQFAQHLGSAARSNLTGGASTAALRGLFDGLAIASRDATTVTHYSATGRVASVQDGEGTLAISQYNSFGELSLTRQQVDATGTRWQERSYAYDRRGLLTTTTADPGGRAVVTVNAYDAFGRVQTYTDENLHVHRTAYDRLGHVVETQDPLTPARLTTYDAFGRVRTQRDALGHVTAYEYNLAERSLTIRSADGTADQVTTRITYNRHGQQYQVTDARGGNTTTYEYDSAGRVTRVSDTLGTLQTTSYDPLLGTVVETTDANGVLTRYSYDAVQRVQLRVVDPAGVAATTSYVYGEDQRTLRETGPDGVVTLTRYDRRGQVASVTVDPDGPLALVTAYEYDGAGRTLAVTDPNGHRRTYAYDTLGRRTSETVDPEHLQLTTLYTYDDRGNLTQRTDPLGHATRFAYDAADRLVFTIDALGGVTELRYDDNGQVVARIAYAQPVTTAWGPAPGVADVRTAVLAVADATKDRVEQSFFDALGRVRFTLDSSGAVSEQRFDRNGNVERRISYAAAWTGAVPANTQALADALRDHGLADPAHDRLEIQFFDARNRVTHRVDGAGGVTVFGYDAAGHVVESLAYATAIANPQALTDLASLTPRLVADPAHDAHSRRVYDTAGRLVATATAQQLNAQGQPLWAVQQLELDAAGRVATSTRRANFLAGSALPATPTQEQVRAWIASVGALPAQDSAQRFVYDSAGRLVYSIDATGAVTRSVYDDAGNIVQRVSYVQPVSLTGTVSKPRQVEDALGTAALADPANRSTLALFDAADRQRLAIDALGNVTSFTLDARGNRLAVTRHAKTADTHAWTLDRGYEALAADADFTQWLAASAATGQDRVERSVYDALDRSTHSVDALGFVKRRDYDALGRLVTGVAFAQSLTSQVAMTAGDIDHALGVADQGALPASARVERFEYDSRGLLVRSTDAEGRVERFSYDGVGNKREFFNKAGALWTYDYDAAGRLLAEKTPQVEVASVTDDGQGSLGLTLLQAQLETRLAYDALGHLTQRTEAFGLPGARTTTYGYDAAGRQVRVTYPAVMVYTPESQEALLTNGFGSAAARVEQSRTLSTQTTYDALGRAVVDQDLGGNFRYRSYDAAGQLAYEVDAEGAVTGYKRNAFGEVEKLTRFAQAIGDLPARAGQPYTQADLDAAYRPGGNPLAGRTLQFIYDLAGHQLKTIEPEALVYDPTRVGAAGSVASAGRTTEQTFNAFGEVTRRSVYGQGGKDRLTSISSVYLYYSRKGEVIGELTQVKTDQAYLTRRFYDAVGNLEDQFEYATAVSGNDALWSAAASPDDLGFAAKAPEDRHTSWAYDKTNRKLSETRHQVLHSQAGSGGIITLRGDLSTTFGYDAVGNKSRVTDALGASTYTYHDVLGRVTAVVAPAVPVTDAAGASTFIRPLTRLHLDAYGNVVEQVAYAGGALAVSDTGYTAPAASAMDRRTLTRYDSHGHVVQVLDATGASSQRSYDEFGRIAKEWRSFTDADGRIVTSFQQYRYDKVGRQVAVLTPASTAQLVALDGRFTVAIESRSQASIQPTWPIEDNVGWLGTNTVRLGFPALAAGTTLQVELRYRTGEYGTPGAPHSAVAEERSKVFELASGDGRSVLLSWTDSSTRQGLSEVLGFVVRVRDASGQWVTQHDARQELIGLDKTQIEQRSQLAAGVVAETLQFNTFGEVEKKRRNGQVVEQYDYNAAGQVWRSFSGNGVWHGLLHDVDGHVTADIRSADPDRLRVALDETEVAGLRASQTTNETRYDLMGRVVAQVLPTRSAAAQAGSVATPAMLTWTLTTGSQAKPVDDAYTRYGQGPIYKSTSIFSSLQRLPTRIDLQWASLANLGSGDVEVQVDYTDTQSSQRTEVQRFRAEDAQGGATLYWTAPAVASVIHRVLVKKKDTAGEWVTVLDRASQGTYGSRAVFQGPSAVDAAVTLRYRLQGTGTWAEASVAAGTLKNFGNAYLFAPTDALSGTYEYELWATNTGQTASTLRDKGSMTLASTAIAVGSAATLAGQTSSVLSWVDPGSTQTQVFHYRQQGSRNWQSLAVSTVATGRKGVDLKTLPDGIYEYELLYYAAGQLSTPNAHATGVFTTRAARAAGDTLANVDAIAQPLGVVAAQPARWIEWARPTTDVEVQFSYRLIGASAWFDLPARAVGSKFRVDASALAAGTYDYSVTYKNPITHVALSSAGGTLTVQANGSARIVPVTGYIPATNGPLVNVSSLSASEEEGYAVFRVGLSAASASVTRLELAVYGGTAGTQDFGTDLQVSMDSGLTWQQSRAVNLAAGQTGFLARTQIFDDHQLEANERFYLTATRTIGNTTNEVAAGMAVIQDNDDLPRLSVSDVVVAEDGGVAYFTVLLSRPVTSLVTVGYSTADQTALAGQDYTGVSGVLSFAPGITRQTVAVPITDDNRFEAYTEAFRLQLHSPVGAQIDVAQGTGTIADDEPYGGPLIAVSIPDVVQEGSYAQFDISLSGPTQTATSLNLELYGGDATAGIDYSAGLQVSSDGGATWTNASSGVIAAGQTTLKARVLTANDAMYEGNESFSLRATRTGGTTTNTVASAMALIVDNDPVPTLSVADRTVNESAGTVSFNVTLSNPSALPVTVTYLTWDGSATAGTDYVAKVGTLSFAPGTTSQGVTITLLDDTLYEGSESFSLMLVGATNASIAPGVATATLQDNEGVPVLGVNTAAANEGGYMVWDLSLSTASATATGVTLVLDSGNATAGVDYVNTLEVSSDGGSTWASATSASFAAGKTALKVRVRTLDDGLYEGIETLSLTATRSSGSTANASAFGYGGLLDNESMPVIAVTGTPVTEGGDALFQIDLLTPSASATTLALAVNYAGAAAYGGGTGPAASGADFSGALEVSTDGGATWSTTNSVTLAAGQTRALARLHTVDDAFYEGTEGFSLTATRTAGTTANTSAVGVSELRDNDTTPVLSLGDAVASEGSYAVFNAELSGASSLDTSFGIAVYGGTAALGSDASGTAQVSTDGGATWATAASATIAAGQTRVLIRVATVQDNLYEGNESFTIQLTRNTGSTANASATATATVLDDEPVPGLSISDATVNENAGTATFTVSLSGPSTNTVTVAYSTADVSAVAGNDYTAKSGTLSFAPGVTSQTVTVSLVDDAWYEGSESFTLNLGTATGAQVSDASGLATVLDNEGAPSLSVGNVTVNEAAATATFTVTLSTPSVFGITVNYTTADGSATAGADYTAKSGQLSFAPGVTSQTVTINLLDDAVYEGAENFSVVLSGAVNAGIAAGSGNALVTDSEAAPTLSVSSSPITEGGYAVFQIDLSTASAFATGLSLNAAEVYGGSAVAGLDFSTAVQVSTDGGATWSNNSNLTLAAGQTRAYARVLTLDDNVFEGTENFQLIATRTTGATANASASSYGGILDNEVTPSLSISSLSVAEGSYAVFNVDLSAANTTATSFGFGAYGGSAAAGADFNSSAQISYDNGSTWTPASSATFTAGQTHALVRVATVQDNLYEGTESFTLGLTLISGTSSNTSASGTATVIDDEALPSLSVSDATVNENAGTATFTVSLSGPSAGTITVAYGSADQSALAGNDYTAKSGTLTFAPGVTSQTVTVSLLDDTWYEGTESFLLNLGTATGAQVADGQGLATVLDNEASPSLSIGNIAVNETAATATFTVSLNNASATGITVNYATADGSATAGTDYTAKSGTLTFNPGVTSQTITISLLDDAVYEGAESFSVALSGAVNAGIAIGSASATVTDSEAVPTLSVSSSPVTEGGYAVFQIDLSTASTAATSVSLNAAEVYGGNAVAGLDFSTAVQVSTDGGATWSNGGNVTIAAGQTRAYARVLTLDDNLFEGTENFQLIATRTAGNTANASASSYGGILDNEVTPSLSISSLSVAEGSYAVFNVDLSAANTTATSFGFGAYGGSAAAGSDFSSSAQISYDNGSTWTPASSATFAAGQTHALVRVATVQDNLYEGNESFTLGLTLISGTSSNTGATGTATVIDDEVMPTLSVSDATVNENAGTATFTVSLSGPSASTITVAYGSADQSALGGNDYTAKSGTLSFAPGVTSQTVTIALLDDATYEGTETFVLNLGTVSGASVADGTGLGTILDNESVPSLSVGNLTVNENAGTASFTVSLSNATTAAVTVNYATANGSATAGADYTAKSGTLTFNPGVTSQTVTITLLDDSLFEGSESFSISLSGAANAGIATGSATATLLDNDAVPTLSVSNTPVTEGGYAVFQIDLSTASAAATGLSLSAAEVYGGNAVAGVDFSTAVQVSTDGGATWSSGSSVTIAAGQTRAYARVQTIDDNYFEGNESFQLIATRTAGNTANASASSYGGIIDNDTTPSLSISSLSVAEGSYAVFNVDLSAANTTATSFGFGAYGGSAAAGSDFNSTAQISYDNGSSWANASIATMAAGQTRVLVRVATVQDNLYEGNESFTLGLTLISGTSTNTGATGTATVIDDEVMPSLSVSDATVNENAGTVSFTVSLSGPSAGTITVAYGSANGSATAGNDYTAKTGTLTFNPGVTSQTVTVSLLDDTWYEGNESFALNLGTVSGATIADGSGLATILDNEAFPNASIGNVSVNENAGTATFTVSLSNASASTVTLNYATANGSATAGADYTAKSGSLTFNPGVTSQTVTIDLLDDAWYEGNESFSVGLSAAVNANIATASASATVIDNEAVPTFTVGNASVSEGGYAVFQVDLSTASATATGLSLALAAGSAGADVDYSSALQVSTDGGSTWSAGSSLTLAAGQTRAYARVLTIDDTWYEGNEGFQLTATRTAGTTTNASVTASATIVENESMPTLSVSNASVAEGGYAVFNVDLSTASSTATSVNLAATAGSAAAGTDFTNSAQVSYDGGSTWATATAATLAAGQTRIQVRVATVQDGLYEGNEAFTLTATRSAGTTTNTSAAGSGTIVDDEPFPSLAINDATVNETAGTVTFTITLSVPSAGAVTVVYNTADISAAAGSDYTARSGTLTFNPGVTSQTLTVNLQDDTTFEGTESFALNLSNAGGASIGDASGLATLLDNDSAPSMSIGAVTVNENAGTATFTVSLSNATTAAVTVNYATANGSATAGADYTAASGTLTFNPGVTSQTITIGLLDDAVYEAANETFSVSLSGAANASIATASATATVVDNEGLPGVRISDVTIGEAGGAAVFTITLSNASVNPVSVSYATANGTAYGGSDFTATSGTLSFTAGQTSKTVSVNIINDTKYETSTNEYFYVNLSALTGGSFLDSQGQGFIVDNDAYGAPGVTSVSAKATASLAATASTASTASVGATVAADPESLSAYGGGFGATGTTPALPFLEAVIVGTVSWDVPPGAASASFRYRREGSVDWIESDTTVAAGRMSAFIDSPGYGTVEYDVNFFKAGESTPFAYAAGTVMMGNGAPVLTQSVGPRTRSVATAAQAAQYSTSATTFAGGTAISLPDTGLASAALASTSAGPGALTPEIHFELDRWGNQVAITDARSAEWVTRYAYNDNNQLIQETRPDASASQTFYDALGRQIGTQDALGHVNTQALDAAGHVLTEQHADGGVVSHLYDAFGDQRRTVDAEGHVVEYSYDAMGRMVMRRVTDVQVGTWVPINQASGTPQWQLNVNDGVLAESYQYDESGHRIAVTRDAGGAAAETTRYRYDARGNVIEVLQPLGQAQRFSYDEHDLKSAEVDANGYYNRWDFDDYGRLASSTELSGDTLAYQYDGLGNLAHSSRNHDGTLLDTWYSYDNAGQVLRVADEATGTLTEYAYDAAGRHVQERTTVSGTVIGVDAYGGAATTYSGGSLMQDNTIGYDALGRVRVVQDGRHFTSMDYDAAGNRIHMRTRYANDNDTRRDYDYWYSYDAMNRQLVVDGVRDEITGRIDVAIGQGHRLSYDRVGNRTSDTTYGRHALLYTPPPVYDKYYGEIPQDSYWKTEAGYTTERYSYDAANRLVHTERDGIDVDTRLYDAASRVVRSGPAPTAEQRVLWTTADNHWDVPAQARTTRFDANGRTTAQELRGLDGGFIQSVSNYRYDAAGNVLRYQLLGNNVTNTYDTTYERIGGAYKQTLQRGRSTQLEEGNTTFAYNAAGHLTSVVDARASVNNRQFATDLQGRILEKTSYTDESGRTVPHRERTLVVNGEEWGTSGDDKTEKGRSGVDGTRKDGAFSVGYRKIDGTYPNVAPSSYTVSDGDTLQSIAKAIYGDAAQWYRIAETNGLNLDTPLTAGQALVLPSVVGSANNAGTVNPYDPLSRIGDTNPTMPAPPPSADGGCGVLGQILIIVVAVVVTIYTAGAASAAMGSVATTAGGGIVAAGTAGASSLTLAAASTAQVFAAGTAALSGGLGLGATALGAAAIGGAVGSIASQGAAMAMNMQDHFSWKQVGQAALGSAVTAGVGAAAQAGGTLSALKGTQAWQAAGRAAISSGINQALHGDWSWREIAASAVGAGAGAAAGNALKDSTIGDMMSPMGQRIAAGVVGGVAGQWAGPGGKANYGSVFASALGNALGENIVSAMSRPEMPDAIASAARSDSTVADTYRRQVESLGKYMSAEQARELALKGYALSQLEDFGGNTLRNYQLEVLAAAGKSSSEAEGLLNYLGFSARKQGTVEVGPLQVVPAGEASMPGTAPVVPSEPTEPTSKFGQFVSNYQNELVKVANASMKVGEFIEEHPIAKYGLLAVEVASGPLMFAGRQLFMASPMGEALNNLQESALHKASSFVNDEAKLEDVERASLVTAGGITALGLAVGGVSLFKNVYTAGRAFLSRSRHERFNSREAFVRATNDPAPNTTYHLDGVAWKTDRLGRLEAVEGPVQINPVGRNDPKLQRSIGYSGRDTDVGFHVWPDQWGGPTSMTNVVPGNGRTIGDGLRNLNNGAYADFEREVTRLARDPSNTVQVRITPSYAEGNLLRRPDMFTLTYRVNGSEWVPPLRLENKW